jgi:hypothetical protein
MRKKNVIVLGDSFIYGHGCSDREYYVDTKGQTHGTEGLLDQVPSSKCWPALLAQELHEQINVVNLSMPGIDNQSLLSSLCNFLDNNADSPDLIMFNTCPGGRMLIADHNIASIYVDKTPQLFRRLINLEELTKSKVWRKVFNGTKVSSVAHSKEVELTNFAGKYYHSALDVQSAVSALLSMYSISQCYSAKFLWAPNLYCNIGHNLDVIPLPLRRVIDHSKVQHISKFQQLDPNKFTAPDGHTSDLGHSEYLKIRILSKIKLELGLV